MKKIIAFFKNKNRLNQKDKTEEKETERHLTKEKNDNKLDLETEVNKRLPLVTGDIIEFESGREYKVCHMRILGDINISNYHFRWLNKPELLLEKNPVEQLKFDSLRELNYYIEEQKHLIVKVQKVEFAKMTKELTIDECHEMALEENEKRKQLDIFFHSMNENHTV